MVKFLLKRPIAVFMASLAFLLLGLVAMFQIPTALMPDIPIPEITVRLNYPNNSVRDLETNVVRPLRNQLLQVGNLKNIKTETRDGSAILKLHFEFGTNTDLAFIETNEKVDASMNLLPRNLERPRVIKASATDIPILNITVTPKKENHKSFLELSEFTQNVLKRRIEQLPDIALADISGLTQPEVIVQPNPLLMQSLGVSNSEIINVIAQNNFELGNLIVQNGIYQYNFKFSNPLRTVADIENIQLKVNGQLLRLEDLAKIELDTQQERGSILFNGKKSILISVIKQSGTQIVDLKKSLNELLKTFRTDYPNLNFQIHQDQTKLLELSINNLRSSLIIGSFLAIIIMFFFLKDIKLPIIIGLSIPTSLILSFLFMYLIGMSINIISLSGLILGVGMMVDNAIIMIDNITQKMQSGKNYFQACAQGTSEMISPLISSVLTTCMVFLPLLFLSGITGVLFYDQAIAVTIGLTASLLVAIVLIPVLYLQLKKRKFSSKKRLNLKFKTQNIESWYEIGFNYLFDRKYITWAISFLFLGLAVVFMLFLPYSKLPEFTQTETVFKIDWNENINITENEDRINKLLGKEKGIETSISQVGEQQFLLNKDEVQDFSRATIYLETNSPHRLEQLKKNIVENLKVHHSESTFTFSAPSNIFEYIFGDDSGELIAQVYSKNGIEVPPENKLQEINELLPEKHLPIAVKEAVSLSILQENLLLYHVDYATLVNQLKTIFDQNFIDDLKSTQRYIPIKLNYEIKTLEKNIESRQVLNNLGTYVPLKYFILINPIQRYKTLTGDKAGEFLEFNVQAENNQEQIIQETQEKFKDSDEFGVRFRGSYFDMSNLGRELFLVLGIAILLLYFVMAAQFESLIQPIIVLLEIPIDIGAALLFLWLFGGTINIMSAIGIVVMIGIVINDSIIKIHTINVLRKEGLPLFDAIKEGGHLRIKAIIMTSLTTILALLPFLFISGLGAELQLPLALTIIGGMTVGTFISLYFVPLLYYYLYKNRA